MGKLENSLQEELKRFNQIGYNATNLEEQMLGGFQGLGMGSHVDRIMGTKKSELGEQEDPEEPAEEEIDTASFEEMGVGDDVEAEVETTTDDVTGDVPPPPPPATPAAEPAAEVPVADVEAEEDTTEVEVTDLVDKQENLEKNSEETNDKLD